MYKLLHLNGTARELLINKYMRVIIFTIIDHTICQFVIHRKIVGTRCIVV